MPHVMYRILLILSTMWFELYSTNAFADFYQRAVHFECNPGAGSATVTLYLVYESKPVLRNDRLFDELAKLPSGLTCNLSEHGVVAIHAMSSSSEPANDNLQVTFNGHMEETLTVDSPFVSALQNPTASVRIERMASGKFRLHEENVYNLE